MLKIQEHQKSFIQRHIKELIKKNLEASDILEKSLGILDDASATKNALQLLEKTGSITQILHQLEIIQLDNSVAKIIQKQEKQLLDQGLSDDQKRLYSFVGLLDASETITELFKLLKTRLSLGLSYALWLSVIATGLISIVSGKVLPQFKEIFNGFGAELPLYTQMALNWQTSLLSPMVIGLFFIVTVGFLLFSVSRLSKKQLLGGKSKQPFTSHFLSKIPFIKHVIHFTHLIHWLSQLRILNSSGLKLEKCLTVFPEPNGQLEKLLPNAIKELKAAEQIGNLDSEYIYQVNQLSQLGEMLVTKASQRLVAMVMTFVIGFVVFTIFASYLPIFQLGAVI